MKAVLLAAGRGTRLAPLTESVPKILAPLNGRPLLEHQLSYLAAAGVTEVAINVHHLPELVMEAIERIDTIASIRVSHEPELLGTAGALRPLRDFLDESFVVLYGDVVTDADLGELMAHHRSRKALATLTYYRSEELAAKGLMTVSGGGRVASFVEKPTTTTAPAFVNAGLYVLEPEIVLLVDDGFSDFGNDVWPRLASEGERLFGYELVGAYVRDIGSPDALEQARRALARVPEA